MIIINNSKAAETGLTSPIYVSQFQKYGAVQETNVIKKWHSFRVHDSVISSPSRCTKVRIYNLLSKIQRLVSSIETTLLSRSVRSVMTLVAEWDSGISCYRQNDTRGSNSSSRRKIYSKLTLLLSRLFVTLLSSPMSFLNKGGRAIQKGRKSATEQGSSTQHRHTVGSRWDGVRLSHLVHPCDRWVGSQWRVGIPMPLHTYHTNDMVCQQKGTPPLVSQTSKYPYIRNSLLVVHANDVNARVSVQISGPSSRRQNSARKVCETRRAEKRLSNLFEIFRKNITENITKYLRYRTDAMTSGYNL
jgi:hypothetical protein